MPFADIFFTFEKFGINQNLLLWWEICDAHTIRMNSILVKKLVLAVGVICID